MGYAGAGRCTIDVGTLTPATTVGDPGGAAPADPAVQWTVDDPSDGLRIVSTEDAWIYERPTAEPLLAAYGNWQAVPDVAAAAEAIAGRTPGAPYRAVVSGPDVPEAPPVGAPNTVEVRSSDMGEGGATIDVSSAGPALVAYRTNFSTDWQATVDGRPVDIARLNGAQLGVFVPSGEHRVEFRYVPQAFIRGLMVSVPALVLVAAAGVWTAAGARRRRRTS